MSTVNGILQTKVTFASFASEEELEEIISEIVAAANFDAKDAEVQQVVVFRPHLCTKKEDDTRMVRAIEKEGHKVTIYGAGSIGIRSIGIRAFSGGFTFVDFIWGYPRTTVTDDDAGATGDDDSKPESVVNNSSSEIVATLVEAVAKVEPKIKITPRAIFVGDDYSETDNIANHGSDKEVIDDFKTVAVLEAEDNEDEAEDEAEDEDEAEAEDEAEDEVGVLFSNVNGDFDGASSDESSYEDYDGFGLTQEAYIPTLADLEMPEPSPAPLRRSTRRFGN